MARIPAAEAAAMFEEIIGWPYVSPGTCDARGIDCSGAWVRVYRRFGLNIDHGSNSQYRRFCGNKGVITDPNMLRAGMAVFKVRAWTSDQQAHRDYGTAPGNLYHVGCVTRAYPLRIVHATPDAAKTDIVLGNWKYWGMLKGVAYDEAGGQTPSVALPSTPPSVLPFLPDSGPAPAPGQAKVITTTSGLRLRKKPDKSSATIQEMPRGTIVQLLRLEGVWANVRWDIGPGLYHIGWCCIGEGETEYLQFG